MDPPTDLGSGESQDVIGVRAHARRDALEDPLGPKFTAMSADDRPAGKLLVVLQWHAYAAAFRVLYPRRSERSSGRASRTPERNSEMPKQLGRTSKAEDGARAPRV